MKKFTNLILLMMVMLSSSVIFAQCDYQIELTDPGWGDGWNGGKITVFVNGNPVLTDITLASGAGPEYHVFTVGPNGMISTDYTPGSWSSENHYKIIDPDGVVLFETGYPNGTPVDMPATLGCPSPVGDVAGFVYGADNTMPIQGAEVGVEAMGIATHSGADGSYLLSGVAEGDVIVYCQVPGVNMAQAALTVTAGATVNQDFYIVPPNVSAQPNALEETLNPNEYLTSNVTLFNMGDGDAYWTAEVVNGGTWLSVGTDEGVVPANGNLDVPVVFNAAGTNSGDVFNGEIRFIIHPEVDTVVVPATMIVFGDPLSGVTDLTAVIGNMTTGKVNLAWNFSRTPTFQYFEIERNGQTVGTTTNHFYSDMLPDYGTYSYKVYPVYDEGKGLPGGPETVIWGIPELTWMPDTLIGNVWVDNQVTLALNMKNSGEGQLHFEFTGFDDPYFHNSYITSVSPYSGDVLAGDSMNVYVTFDATGFSNGSFNAPLLCETNELAPNNSHNIPTTMNVTTPGSFKGVVTDCDNGTQLENVEVTAVNQADPTVVFTAQTVYNGSYELYVTAGDYDITFHKLGYDDATATGTATEGNATTVDGCLSVTPYPVSWVTAQVNDPDNACYVEWSVPMGPYEIIYDDGSAEDYVVFIEAGGAAAVRFTPAGYPATVTGGRVYVGDGSFPENGANFLGTDIAVGIMDDDGTNNGPGTVLDSTVITINNYGWVEFNGAFNRTFNDGDYYIVVWQLNGSDQTAPIGIDTDIPTVYRSYAKPAGFDWVVSSYQDMMIRSFVSGPNQGITMNADPNKLVRPVRPIVKCYLATSEPKVAPGYMKAGTYRGIEAENAIRGFSKYRVARIDGFDPDAGQGPEDGTRTYLGFTTQTHKNDTQFGGLAQGWYAYAVKAKYETGASKWTYSNIVGHLMDITATFKVTQCDGLTPNNVEVTLTGHNYPYNTYFLSSGDDGIIVFDSVIKGLYDIRIFKVGYQPQEFTDVLMMDDYVMDNVVLQENAYPARNLYVDALTSVATWDEPLITQIALTDFENPVFPPAGWQATTLTTSADGGWYRSAIADGKMSDWIIPDWEGHYAVTNDDFNGSGSFANASMDYLITPKLDLRESDDFALYFDRFFDALYDGMATVEYSTDNGSTWDVLLELSGDANWKQEMIDLSTLSGENGLSTVWFAFHYNDGTVTDDVWADGWAIDNVELHNGAAPIQGYVVYLDNAQVAELPADVRTYAYGDLVYGTTYTASVRAKYGCGLSEPIFYTWQSTYLYPPRNLGDDYVYNTNEVPLKWNPPVMGDGIPMMAAEPTVVYQGAPQNVTANSDAAPMVTVLDYGNDNSSRDTWDLQFTWPTFYNDGEAGVECDGEFIYTAKWNGDRFSKYTLDGTWVEDFTIPGVSGVRDLAFDGEFMYGAAANTSVFQMDFVNHTLVSTINAPTAVRAIAYNDEAQTFYGNNWSTDITEFDMTGAFVSSFAAGGLTGVYGMAYDNWSEGGPYLWVYDQGANNLNQATLPDGTFTGFTVDVPAITGATSGAGGLFTQPGIVEGTVTIGGNAQNEMVWGLELAPYAVSGGVPDGLLSFNVYRDGQVVGNKEYNGEGADEWVYYVDNNVMPGTYFYEVSALYDLGQFGFPGEIGESALEGVDTVTVVWGMDLPFSEDWKSGNFDFNNWSSDATNWKINSQIGDDAPSAEFTWDPLLENDYAASLTTAPLKADMLSEGDIWLDYNLKLNDRNSTGEEHLKVEVYDGNSWNQVSDIANNGSFDFADGFNHINISNYAMGKVFQVRFTATGLNSFDVISWFVDNINVYRTCAGPKDLEHVENPDVLDIDEDAIMIAWEAPEIPMPIAEWLHWDSGENFSAIGLTDGGDFTVAARWDAGQLADYDGTFITKLQYFPATTDFSNVIVRIWTGANAANLVYENDVTASSVAGMWNEVTLDTPLALDVNDELWIGYTLIGQVPGTFPAGTDAGPAIAGYGDKITMDGITWDNLSDFGLSYNWNVQVYVEESSTNASTTVTPLVDNTDYSTPNATLSRGSINQNGGHAITTSSREFTGFRVFRSDDNSEGSYAEIATVPYEEGVTAYTYTDMPEQDWNIGDDFYYKVSAVWSSDDDNCESAYAPAKLMPIYDYVSVVVTSVDNALANTTSVYPNPATNNVTVTTTEGMSKLTVINYVGQVVYQKALNGENSVNLSTGNYEAGVYVIRIETTSGTINKRVVITK